MSVKLVGPGEKLDWAFDWATNVLDSENGETISSHAWTLYDGPSSTSDVAITGGTTATVFVPDGLVPGKVYRLDCSVLTSAGRKYQGGYTLRCGHKSR